MDEVENYIGQFPEGIQAILRTIRALIKSTAPDAEESMAYGMPAYKTYKKPLVYFAAFQHHIGFYATPSGHEAFEEELSQYKQGKGSVQFPLNRAIPYGLIEKMVKFRAVENKNKAETKSKRKGAKHEHDQQP